MSDPDPGIPEFNQGFEALVRAASLKLGEEATGIPAQILAEKAGLPSDTAMETAAILRKRKALAEPEITARDLLQAYVADTSNALTLTIVPTRLQNKVAIYDEDGTYIGSSEDTTVEQDRQKRRLAIVQKPVGAIVTTGKERIAIVVPVGYETDFASIPDCALLFVQPFGRHAEAAVIHDWMYSVCRAGNKKDKRRADRVMLALMKLHKVNPVTRGLISATVFLLGSGAGDDKEWRFRDLAEYTKIKRQEGFEEVREKQRVKSVAYIVLGQEDA